MQALTALPRGHEPGLCGVMINTCMGICNQASWCSNSRVYFLNVWLVDSFMIQIHGDHPIVFLALTFNTGLKKTHAL